MLGLGEVGVDRRSGSTHEQLLGVPRGHRDDVGDLSAVVSLDLAARRTRDIGVAVLGSGAGGRIHCEWVRGLDAELGAVPAPESLGAWLAGLARACGAELVLIDGPQAWKDPANGLLHCRVSERAVAAQAKTGLPGVVLPGPQRRFTELSIALFDALALRGFARFDPTRPERPAALEVFPTACWRGLGERALPAKTRATSADLARASRSLRERWDLRFRGSPSHDELQAAVAGLVGIALLGHARLGWTSYGLPPVEVGGIWREGVIAVASLSNSSR